MSTAFFLHLYLSAFKKQQDWLEISINNQPRIQNLLERHKTMHPRYHLSIRFHKLPISQWNGCTFSDFESNIKSRAPTPNLMDKMSNTTSDVYKPWQGVRKTESVIRIEGIREVKTKNFHEILPSRIQNLMSNCYRSQYLFKQSAISMEIRFRCASSVL